MLSPQTFAQKTGLSYGQVLLMCKKKEINTVVSPGGHFKIPEKELERFIKNEDYVSKEDYEKVVRENERLKTLLKQVKGFISGMAV
jgi:excisionase family DNA binding protein